MNVLETLIKVLVIFFSGKVKFFLPSNLLFRKLNIYILIQLSQIGLNLSKKSIINCSRKLKSLKGIYFFLLKSKVKIVFKNKSIFFFYLLAFIVCFPTVCWLCSFYAIRRFFFLLLVLNSLSNWRGGGGQKTLSKKC